MPIRNVVYRQREAGQVLTDLSDYRRAGGYEALRKALSMGGDAGVHVVDDALHGSDAVATSLVLAEALVDAAQAITLED